MRWWICAIFLGAITVIGSHLSLRWGSRQSGIRADLVLGLAITAVIFAAVMLSFMW
jgi:hypothetical protein